MRVTRGIPIGLGCKSLLAEEGGVTFSTAVPSNSRLDVSGALPNLHLVSDTSSYVSGHISRSQSPGAAN